MQDAAGRLTRLADLPSASLRRLRDDVLRLVGPLLSGEGTVRRAQQEDPAALYAAVWELSARRA